MAQKIKQSKYIVDRNFPCICLLDPDEMVQVDTFEVWELNNTGGGMVQMMNMPHPIHLHGKQFRVIERSGVMHESYVDEG